MNEEGYIREKMGTRNPFTVPDGYFDQLSEQIIGSLPEEAPERSPKPAIVRFMRPLLYAAACVALVIAVSVVLRNNFNATESEQLVGQQQETVNYSDTYMEDMADYAMLDNEDIYASLLADL